MIAEMAQHWAEDMAAKTQCRELTFITRKALGETTQFFNLSMPHQCQTLSNKAMPLKPPQTAPPAREQVSKCLRA